MSEESIKKYSPRIGVITDDLTGGGDVGVQFSDRGLKTVLSVDISKIKEAPADAEVWIINTNSRGLNAARAARRVRKAIQYFKNWSAGFYYKKIDSTLRGNIGAELEAVIEELGLETLPLCAAFPEMGRTTVNNIQYVFGRKLEETQYADDPESPVLESSLKVLLAGQMKNPDKVQVLDASSDEDIMRLAGEYTGCCFAGAAAWSGKLAEVWLPAPRNIAASVLQPGPVLVVSGSINSVSLGQEADWRSGGKKVITPDSGIKEALAADDLLIKTQDAFSSSALRKLSRFACSVYESGNWDRVILNGGDTAYGFLNCLGVQSLEIVKSLYTGIALTSGNKDFFVLKPGGYGESSTLRELAEILGGK